MLFIFVIFSNWNGSTFFAVFLRHRFITKWETWILSGNPSRNRNPLRSRPSRFPRAVSETWPLLTKRRREWWNKLNDTIFPARLSYASYTLHNVYLRYPTSYWRIFINEQKKLVQNHRERKRRKEKWQISWNWKQKMEILYKIIGNEKGAKKSDKFHKLKIKNGNFVQNHRERKRRKEKWQIS